MTCTICGAEGVTKLTCPFNPDATNPKPQKHNTTRAGAGAAVGVAQLPKIKAKLKAPATPAPVFSVGSAEVEAQRLFPGDLKMQSEYVADMVRMELPRVPVDDTASKVIQQQQEKLRQTRTTMADRCQRCLKAVSARDILKDADWIGVSRVCAECHQLIGALYHDSDFKEPYNRYHRQSSGLPVDQFLAHGARDGYYNDTMYEGAKFWEGAASRRAVRAFPSVPTRLSKKI